MRDTSLCGTISKGYCKRYGGVVSRTGPLRSLDSSEDSCEIHQNTSSQRLKGPRCRGANTGRFGNFDVFPVFCRPFWARKRRKSHQNPLKCWRGAGDHLAIFSFSGVSQTIVKHSTWEQCPQVLAGKARKVAKSTRLCSYTGPRCSKNAARSRFTTGTTFPIAL